VAVFTPITTALPYLSSSCEIPDLATHDAAAPGIFSGFLWNVGWPPAVYCNSKQVVNTKHACSGCLLHVCPYFLVVHTFTF
jgi:hypothetical protein